MEIEENLWRSTTFEVCELFIFYGQIVGHSIHNPNIKNDALFMQQLMILDIFRFVSINYLNDYKDIKISIS